MTGYIREHGVDAFAVRFSWIYGPGRRTPTTLERLIRAGLAGEQVSLDEDARQRTHYVYIDDAIAAVLAAARAPEQKRHVYNITAGTAVPLQQVTDTLMGLLPRLHVRFGQSSSRSSGPAGFDLTHAANDLGYRPQVSLAEGLRRYVEALGNK
jgi:nucleoside-diphosphate-sugar epimerase